MSTRILSFPAASWWSATSLLIIPVKGGEVVEKKVCSEQGNALEEVHQWAALSSISIAGDMGCTTRWVVQPLSLFIAELYCLRRRVCSE